MADAEDEIPEDAPEEKKKSVPLNTELGRRKSIEEDLLELYNTIDAAYLKAASRINDQIDYWHIYNCETTDNQAYSGNAQVFVPLVRDAVDARVTRFTNQIFPKSGRNVDIITTDVNLPFERMALMEHYIRTTKLRSMVIPALLRNGDVEGQWNLYTGWNKTERKVRYKVQRGMEFEGHEIEGAAEIEDIEEETIPAMSPIVEVIPDSDVMILPHTADSIEEALERGGSVTILRRWTKGDIKRMIKEGEFIRSRGEDLVDSMQTSARQRVDAKKKHVDSAGIKNDGKYVLGYETWTKLEVGGEQTLCRAYFADDMTVLGCKQNPFWHGWCPLQSCAPVKISGVMKGTSPIKKVDTFQYQANDICNQGFDSATYAMQPIVMTDPMRNPRVGSMVMDLAAVWEVSPDSTKFASFPPLWKDALTVVAECRSQIFQSLSVNPSMIPGQTGGRQKRSQAEIANEQQVDVLTTSDVCTALEGGVLNDLLERFAWLDMQFRDEGITVKMYGRAGRKAIMQEVPPLQMGTRYEYVWLGVESARNAQQIQQQIGFMNVLNGIPPQRYPGRTLDFVAIIERAVENIMGPQLAPLVFKDMTDQLSIPPEEENGMLEYGFELPVSPLDDDMKHIQVHQQLMAMGDPHGVVRVHIMAHVEALKAKQMQMAQQPGNMPGQPGKPGEGGPGVAGQPQPGASPAGPRLVKQPPGAVHPDSMPMSMPRKM